MLLFFLYISYVSLLFFTCICQIRSFPVDDFFFRFAFYSGYPTVSSWMVYYDERYETRLIVNVSDRVEMVCNVTAIPDKQNVFWMKDSNKMTTIIRPSGSSTNLIFDPVDFNHAGNYTCNVSNAVGAVTGNTVTLLVNASK